MRNYATIDGELEQIVNPYRVGGSWVITIPKFLIEMLPKDPDDKPVMIFEMEGPTPYRFILVAPSVDAVIQYPMPIDKDTE